MANPFKKGDKVRCILTGPGGKEYGVPGDEFIVAGTMGDSGFGWIPGRYAMTSTDRFVLVEEEKKMTELTPGKKYLLRNEAEPLVFIGKMTNDALVFEIESSIVTRNYYDVVKEYVEPKKGKVWLNIYAIGSAGYVYTSKNTADRNANIGRIACVEIDWVEGQGL